MRRTGGLWSERGVFCRCAFLFFSFLVSFLVLWAVLSLSLLLFAFLQVRFVGQALLCTRSSLCTSLLSCCFCSSSLVYSQVLSLFFLNSVRRSSSSFTLFNEQLYFHDSASFYLYASPASSSPQVISSPRTVFARRVEGVGSASSPTSSPRHSFTVPLGFFCLLLSCLTWGRGGELC